MVIVKYLIRRASSMYLLAICLCRMGKKGTGKIIKKIPSNFSIIIPDGLLRVNKDEYFKMSVNSFIDTMIFINAIVI